MYLLERFPDRSQCIIQSDGKIRNIADTTPDGSAVILDTSDADDTVIELIAEPIEPQVLRNKRAETKSDTKRRKRKKQVNAAEDLVDSRKKYETHNNNTNINDFQSNRDIIMI